MSKMCVGTLSKLSIYVGLLPQNSTLKWSARQLIWVLDKKNSGIDITSYEALIPHIEERIR